MEKKIFNEFVSLFNSLSSAGHLLIGYDNMRFNGELANDKKQQNEIKEQFKLADELSVTDGLKNAESFSLNKLFDEIEDNFYKHKDCIDIYVAMMLRIFIDIVPYYKKLENESRYGESIIHCINFFDNFYKMGKSYNSCSVEQRYLLKTRELLHFFKTGLDALCLNFNVDIMELQRNVGLDIYHRETASTCAIYNEYKKQLNEIWTKENYKEKTIQHNECYTFADIFTVKDWDKYIRALTECTPRLLEYDEIHNAYKFVGNEKKEKGCIAQYFKQLKMKGIINNNINRNELARVLSNCLLNYKISGASIDNESEQYKKIYEKQLFN
ncbi:MAG: hypothetical protein MR848_15430 [Butyricimonas virosa]|nr:hypothetical protein [Butyricimonas virosa]